MAEEQQKEQEDENKRIRPRERALGQKNLLWILWTVSHENPEPKTCC